MGASPRDSVVDHEHRVHADNLFVASPSVFPSPPSVDPGLTILAFSRVAAAAVAARTCMSAKPKRPRTARRERERASQKPGRRPGEAGAAEAGGAPERPLDVDSASVVDPACAPYPACAAVPACGSTITARRSSGGVGCG